MGMIDIVLNWLCYNFDCSNMQIVINGMDVVMICTVKRLVSRGVIYPLALGT